MNAKVSLAAVLAAAYLSVAQPSTIVVDDADRTGKSDARPAIQSAIDAAAASGGGTVHLPKGTYLLNSYRPSSHPWKFYNLRVPSGVTLEGDPGVLLLQGPAGRAPLPPRAELVENNVVAIGTPLYQAITFQDPARNGGFLPAEPTRAGSSTVTLTSRAEAARFAPGDLIAVYAGTAGDVIESETSEVTSVDRATGAVSLAHPLARSFPRAYLAKVTHLATRHVTLRNLAIQGAVPLASTEVFDLTLVNCRLLYDSAGGPTNLVTGMTNNTIRGFRMEGGSVEPVDSKYTGLELPQRNSQDVVFENVTFRVANAVFGEYAAHWKLIGNRFWIYPDRHTTAGIATGGLDIEMSQNVIHGSALTEGRGSGALLTDSVGPAGYMSHIGGERFTGNTIECRADGNNCLRLTTRDPAVDRNTITVTGSALGIKVEGAAANFAITNNTISMENSSALLLNVSNLSAAVIKGNILSGSGPYAIVLSGGSGPSNLARLSAANSIHGFRAAIFYVAADSRR